MASDLEANIRWACTRLQKALTPNEFAQTLLEMPALKDALSAIQELTALKEKMHNDTLLLTGLRELCGYVEDGSCGSVTISQDDATKDWIVRTGPKSWYHGPDMQSAIRAAIIEVSRDNQEY